ncbi:hypothetical protein H634G_10553 [Metarhizium anisopliae BRIP 53293]|uniref:Uncharacterized protein n=1 Tax=Metarhizium anisopliae BRIP 53293 TaxID=1291518 RepID=A0A0D9NNJ4_METAN|nr:hypothetical protein H634G_10553 [Metarhizium anisopliae BRIP 53293]KJK90016.1 hypothetical protein H633G_06131 [Metarhizium anisopliae BRIP 53284]
MDRPRTIYLELTSPASGQHTDTGGSGALGNQARHRRLRNPVKIGAARDGSSRMFPGVSSGVPDQPSTDHETLGSVGILTGDVVRRQGYYSEAVASALIPFKRAQLAF